MIFQNLNCNCIIKKNTSYTKLYDYSKLSPIVIMVALIFTILDDAIKMIKMKIDDMI